MGLAVMVGSLADAIKNDPEGAEWIKADFAAINELLRADGLPVFDEPVQLPQIESRSDCDGFPYSFIHYLRRFYARSVNDEDWHPEPVKAGEDPAKDEILDQVSSMYESHLLCHSDCEGYYVPVDFDDILVSDDYEIPGELLCSSYRLIKELIEIAPKLGVQLDDGRLPDSEATRINSEATEESGEFWIEKLVWLAMFEASRLSIQHKTAIRFC